MVPLSDMTKVSNKNFFSSFDSYDGCIPPGVRLPEIQIENYHYESLGLPKETSNYDFLRALCLKGAKDNGIEKLKNKKAYYDRVKSELKILKENLTNL